MGDEVIEVAEGPEKTRASGFRFQPPLQRVEIIKRSALLDQLDDGMSGRLILLQAPAGYGKTTLLAQWWESLSERGVHAAWLALDEDSRAPIGFVAQLIQAVALSGLDVGELTTAAQRSTDAAAARAALKALIETLDGAAGRQAIILDDYHLAQSPEIDDLLDLLIRRMGDRTNLVVATRRRPGLALAALCAQGQLRELGAGQLRFSPVEVSALLGRELEDERLHSLAERSEGWPIALQLARLWARDKGFCSGGKLDAAFSSGGDLADYLTTQVLAGLPEPLGTFVLEMSAFARFSSALADAVRGATDSSGLMEQLKHRNMLMIPADQNGVWYRQHHLISEFLNAQRSKFGPDRLVEIHARASAWFEQHGMWLEAVWHAAAARDRARAVSLVEKADCVRLCLEEGTHHAQSLFALLSQGEIQGSARIRVARALVLFKQGKLQEGADELDGAERQAAEASMSDHAAFREDLLTVKALQAAYRGEFLSDADRQALEALIDVAQNRGPWLNGLLNNLLCLSLLRQGEVERARLCALEAIRHFQESGNLYGPAFMSVHLGTIYIAQGRLGDALVALGRAEQLALQRFGADASLLALAHVLMAHVAYEANQIERASELIGTSLQTVISSEGWPEVYEIGFAVAADLAIATGDRAKAESILAQGNDVARARQASRVAILFLAKHACIMAREGSQVEARAAVAELNRLQSGQDGLLWSQLDEITLARAHTALAEDASLVDLDALSELSRRSASQGRFRSRLRADVLRALTWFELGRFEQAVGLIGEALARAHPNGYRRLFLDEGPRMAMLLRETLRRCGQRQSTIAGFLPELLVSFSDLTRCGERARLIGALTPREREILRELSRGVPNKLIARALDLTENAVKFHLKNIYRKLGVAGRSMAITVSNKLELCD